MARSSFDISPEVTSIQMIGNIWPSSKALSAETVIDAIQLDSLLAMLINNEFHSLTRHFALEYLYIDLKPRGTVYGKRQSRMNVCVCQMFLRVRPQAIDVLEQNGRPVQEMRER